MHRANSVGLDSDKGSGTESATENNLDPALRRWVERVKT
jgi:hypothetical protein